MVHRCRSHALRYIPSEGYATIVGNYFAYPTTGAFSVPGGYIANNQFVNAGGGIGCGYTFRSVCLIEDNILTDSGGIGVFMSNGTAVRRNTITGSAGPGISVNGRDTLSTQLAQR
ncbi:MAG: right-handed parallel beta-helix repeat-containing protein [Caldilineaceae bacterium]